MHFREEHIYHLYNRGNNRERLFFSKDNYRFFLKKIRDEWRPYCDIINYTLMPNHFHFTVKPNEAGCRFVQIGDQPSFLQVYSKVIGKTLSSYTQAINRQNKTTGSLFEKKTRARCLTDQALCLDGLTPVDYLENCFRYIHNNPVAAMLVRDNGDWPWTSWHEYYGRVDEPICNLELAKKVLRREVWEMPGGGDDPLRGLAIRDIW